MLVNLMVVTFLVFLLVFFSGIAVEVFEKVSHEIKVSRLLLATFLVGVSVSLPELSIGIASAVRQQSQISLGNLIGANLANLSLVIGVAVFVFGTIPVVGDFLKKDLWMSLFLSMMPFLLIADGTLSRFDGVVLILVYLIYIKLMVFGINKQKHLKHLKTKLQKKTKWKIKGKKEWFYHISLLLFSLISMVLVSNWLIDIVLKMTSGLGVSAYWVGLLVLAFGTTVPELALALVASEKKDNSLLIGNILGSVVVNSTLILGIVAIISPVNFYTSVDRGISGLFLIIVLALFWTFTKSKRKLQRWEGAVLVGVYLMFVGLQFIFR